VPARASRTPAGASAPKKSTPKAKPRTGGLPVLPVAIVVALALLGWFLYPMARLHYIEQRKVAQLQTQLAQIQQRNKKLRTEVDKLKTPEGVEEAAHELGLARRGEQVWVSVQGGKVSSAPTTASPVQAASVAPDGWTRFLDTIFGVGGQ
jgi:cell division protein FtsB